MKKVLLSFLLAACFMNSAIVYCHEPKKMENAKERSAIDKVIRTEVTNFYGKKVVSYYQRVIGGVLHVACIDTDCSAFIYTDRGRISSVSENVQKRFNRLAFSWWLQNKSTEKD